MSAGYLGSLVIGAALLVASSRSRHDRAILASVALCMALRHRVFMRQCLSGSLTASVRPPRCWSSPAGYRRSPATIRRCA
ncbi:MAG: hypothetical protein IPK27_17940 [Rhodanobacteraceae bacterium]|nr:hypothetical protein [Rhodanobacteraceae bacterium]